MTEAEAYRWAGLILSGIRTCDIRSACKQTPEHKLQQLADRIAAGLHSASNLGERMATRAIIRRLAEPALHSN